MVRHIYDRYLAGAGMQAIADELDLKYERVVYNIITRKSNAGYIVYNGEELAKLLELRREDIVMAMDAITDPVSLYEPVYSDGGDTVCVMDQVRDSKNTDESWLEHIALKEAIAKLNERERHILALRFFQGKTQMEVSAEIGISQAQVSRLEKNAINQIKQDLESVPKARQKGGAASRS